MPANLHLARALRLLLAAAAAAFVACYLLCAALRCSFPWDLDWMEGGMLLHAARLLRGKSIYAKPSIEFIAYFYTPLYAYVLAGLSHLTGGLSFALGRGVSLTASLATMGMLFYAARREQGSSLAGLFAVGLYAALFRVAGAFYDLARVDSLSLALLLAASLVAYYVPTLRGSALAAVLTVLAFFTKQTSAAIGVAIAAPLLLRNVRHGLVYLGVGALLGALGALWLERTSDGWFSFYIYRGHQQHGFSAHGLLLGFWSDVLFLCPFVLLVPTFGASYGRRTRWLALAAAAFWLVAFSAKLSVLDGKLNEHYKALWYVSESHSILVWSALAMLLLLTAARWLARDEPLRAPDSFFLWLWLGAALASALNYSTQWAFSNCFMPIAVFGSLYSGMVLAEQRGPALACAMLLQLGALYHDPRAQVPSAADREAVQQVFTTLARFPGPVLMPAHPFYSYVRDGTLHAHAMGFSDVQSAGGVADADAAFERGAYPTVVLDIRANRPLPIRQHYRISGELQFQGRTLITRTGNPVRPETVFVHRSVQTSLTR
jgi:hypothetical protein